MHRHHHNPPQELELVYTCLSRMHSRVQFIRSYISTSHLHYLRFIGMIPSVRQIFQAISTTKKKKKSGFLFQIQRLALSLKPSPLVTWTRVAIFGTFYNRKTFASSWCVPCFLCRYATSILVNRRKFLLIKAVHYGLRSIRGSFQIMIFDYLLPLLLPWEWPCQTRIPSAFARQNVLC